MTAAERQHNLRVRKAEQERERIAALTSILRVDSIEEAKKIAERALREEDVSMNRSIAGVVTALKVDGAEHVFTNALHEGRKHDIAILIERGIARLVDAKTLGGVRDKESVL